MSRPHSVTIIAVIAIVVGLYSLVTKVFVVISPEAYRLFLDFGEAVNTQALVRLPVEVHLGHGLIGSVVWIFSGAYMLRGKNWARLLALFWGLTALLLTFIVAGFSLSFYLKSATYLLMLYLLTRRRCLAYFQRAPQISDT
jgi:hypothetical protein